MYTIDEAIARERQLAKEQRSHVGTWDDEYSKKCEEYAEEHELLAEWLEELKMYKSLSPGELISEKQKNDRTIEYSKGFDYGFKTGYKKALDDFTEKVKEIYAFTILEEEKLSEIAEQLKEGASDGNIQ